MNKTFYSSHNLVPVKTAFRRKSLESFNLKKGFRTDKLGSEHVFRKSHQSFDPISQKQKKKQLPQIRYEKEANSSIYFNAKSRKDYFKNLIDSYFESQKLKSSLQNGEKRRYLPKRTSINFRNNVASKTLEEDKMKQSSLSQNSSLELGNYESLNEAIKQKELNDKTNFSKKSGRPSQKLAPLTQPPQLLISPSQKLLFQPQSNFLHRITQAEDDEQYQSQINQGLNSTGNSHSFHMNFSDKDLSFTQNSKSNFNSIKSDSNKKITFENSVIKIYILEEGNKKFRIKEFKNRLFLERHQRIMSYGVKNIWAEYRFNSMSLMMPLAQPLKDSLYTLTPHPSKPDFFFIQPKSLHYRLMANNCQDLFMHFKQFIKDLSPFYNRLINNKINLSNIFYINSKFIIGQWDYTACKETNNIQGNHFELRIDPILKCDKEWLVSPQYLAPQLLNSTQNYKQFYDLWKYDNISDVYSIGVMFLEIITLIPMWMQSICIVNGKMMKPRKGFLYTQNRYTQRMIDKQNVLPMIIGKALEKEISQNQKDQEFFSILLQMIEPQPEKRIKFTEILSLLQL